MGVQVREATYGADGNHLPSYSRQFISFEWGGKHIEDFNLLVVFDNARLEKTVYSDTTDITSVFEGRDGQLFWQSNLQPLTINFKLATDGMTARELDDFREYFTAGIVRQLKLTEKPNRYCWARVASAPSISLLPFEHRVEFEGETIKTSLYKGEIVLNFVADDPYWYADDTAYDTLNTTQRKVNCYEEELPYAGAFTSDVPFCFLGDNFMYSNNTISLNEGKTLETNTTYLLYNPSRANVFPKISFTFTPVFLKGVFAAPTSSETLVVGTKGFNWRPPLIISSIKEAIRIVANTPDTTAPTDLAAELRDKLTHHYARAWALKLVNALIDAETPATQIGADFKTTFPENMANLLKVGTELSPFTVSMDSKEGRVIISYKCNVDETTVAQVAENAGEMVEGSYLYIGEHHGYNANGRISADCCLSVISTMALDNFKIDYKYTY